MPYALLVAAADAHSRDFLAAQLDADGHTVYTAESSADALAKLSTRAIDVALLGDLEHPADVPELIRQVRAGEHQRVHPRQPILTLGATDELTVLRAYEAGSDHHLPQGTGYVVLRAVVAAVVRLTLTDVSSRHLHIGELHIDTAGCTADVNGVAVRLTPTEFGLLAKLATDPTKVFTKSELKRAIGRETATDRTLDSHVYRLRRRLADHGVQLVTNRWGAGYVLASAL
jgi:DNA-binding response OmpR family regulator